MPPTPSSSSGRFYPETNEFPPPPGHSYDQSDAEYPYSEPPQQIQEQRDEHITEAIPYNPVDYADLAPTRPQPEVYNPTEYAAGMAGQSPQDYFQPPPQQYGYQPGQPVSPLDRQPDYQPEVQQGSASPLMTGMQQDAYQPVPQPGYQVEPSPYQQPIERMPEGAYEYARDDDVHGHGEDDRNLGVGNDRNDVGDDRYRDSDDNVSAPDPSERYYHDA